MTKLHTLIRNGFDVVDLLRKLVEEIDQIQEEIVALRQAQGPSNAQGPSSAQGIEPDFGELSRAVEGQDRKGAAKPSKQPAAAQTQQ